MYKYIEPEVAGGLGGETIINNSFFPPKVNKLNYEFSGWLGDDIIESFPCFIVTKRLKEEIDKSNLTGVEFAEVLVTKSEEFLQLYPLKELPDFFWAKIIGNKSDDFMISNDYRLSISEKAFILLNLFNIGNALIEDFESE